jgi:hypothetical protein
MQGTFQLDCKGCKQAISFSLMDLEATTLLACRDCGKKYAFTDDTLRRQLKKFASLCRQIRDSEEILSSSAVAVAVGKEEVKVPFKLLLSRLRSTLDLQVGGEHLCISFRVEPTKM